MRRLASALLVCGLLAALGSVSRASHTTFPGGNGPIAFRRYLDKTKTSGAIFVIRSDGTAERQLTHPQPGLLDDQPEWSPDGSRVVFERCRNGVCAVYVVWADGHGMSAITRPCPGQARPPKCQDNFAPSFAPNGRRVVFASFSGNDRSEIVSTDLRGQRRRILVPYAPGIAPEDPRVSPDGRQLLYVRTNFGVRRPRDGIAIFLRDLTSGREHRVTPWNLEAGDGPEWSPDGRLILFRSRIGGYGQSQLYTIHPDGTGLVRRTHVSRGTTVTSGSFSPDGLRLVFGASGIGGNADIYVMEIRRGAPRPIMRTPLWESAPDWGPS
jgi:TolB protein